MDIANNVWHIAPVPPDVIDHPCPFPEEIPDRLIRLYSYVDDVVLDPFAGSGQTLKVARQLDRQYVGYETIEKYAQLAKARVTGKPAIRPQQLIARFDKIAMTSPPEKRQRDKESGAMAEKYPPKWISSCLLGVARSLSKSVTFSLHNPSTSSSQVPNKFLI